MRHHVVGKKLNRSSGQRRALLRNMVSQVLCHGRIETTEAKAQAVRRQTEKLITLAKRGLLAEKENPAQGVHARRLVSARVNRWQVADGKQVDVVKKLFDEIAPRYQDRQGGYMRMVKLGPRRGDAAPMVVLELVE